ncbi:hypothetical protein [Chitinophaga nivalis]|uniref:T9SS C-terminal target domain-containing protein n=1 Tax=Chitinophaga nivalis TaxID=2991709 RepID=A0ABT3IU66_9BACT|nr:hypothetical protein [Chitinophaga nivalis]MCW3462817.1 hypothetical protein [Chitinophaga nivalis]MCW3487493.1 hypothetical protein [Chitinophaga nivalis]
MKNKSFGVALLSTAIVGAALMSSCKKENQINDGRAVSATQVVPASPVLSGVLGTNHTTKDTILLTSGIEWHLSGLVYVDSADVLIIQAGTRIEGNVSPTTGVAGGGLIITKGAQIIANGTASNPIIFTSERWDSNPVSGDWAGVVLLGKAPTNTPTTKRVEGVPDVSPADATYGGTVSNDNSGSLKFVRIEYAGFALTPNNELNGLTLAGVGSGTTIDYVEVYKANDDAFEFFGGTVNASHLIAVDALDDIFDTDNGYSGTISYALGLSDTTRADISQSNGFESDNDASGSSTSPLTHAKYNYITIVGLPNAAKATATVTGGTYGRAAHLRRNTEFEIKNAIFIGFNKGVIFDNTAGTTYAKFTAGTSTANNVFVHAYATPWATEVSGTATAITTPTGNFGYSGATANVAAIGLTNPFARNNTSAAANYITGVGTTADVANAGAFPGGLDWTIVGGSSSWTRFK